MARGDNAGAVGDLAEAAAKAPADPLIARRHAAALRLAGKRDLADDEYSRALRLEPHPEVWLERCALRVETKRLREAVADCETAHATDPSERSALLMARAYAAFGRPESAVLILQSAAASSPRSGAVRSMLTSLQRAGADQRPAANASRR